MIKVLSVALVLVVLFITGIYIFIPNKLTVSEKVTIGANPGSVYRNVTETDYISRWWTNSWTTKHKGEIAVLLDDYNFNMKPQMFDVVAVHVQHKQYNLAGYLKVITLQGDSALVQWQVPVHTGNNPFTKLQRYVFSKDLKTKMSQVLETLQNFMSKEENVYGLKIKKGSVTDTLLVTTKISGTAHPDVKDYYRLIDVLKKYIAQRGAQEMNYPMLNITEMAPSQYETRVAIPVSKVVPSSGNISLKRMIPGHILSAEVQGGMSVVNEGLKQLELYASEHNLSPPAIPFQSLITNRLLEPDSSKWITRLYYPVY